MDGAARRETTCMLTHGFRRYTGNIPEVLIGTARGHSPKAILISSEGISLVYLPKPWVSPHEAGMHAHQRDIIIVCDVTSGVYLRVWLGLLH